MSDLRTAAQQALEACEQRLPLKGQAAIIDELNNLRAALAQEQDEPAEPVEPVSNEALRLAGLALIGLAEHDQHCDVFDLDDQGRHKACTCGLNDAIAVITQAGKSAPPQQAEPVEPVAWECKAGGLKPLTQRQYDAQTAATKRHYTRIAPPQRQPLTDATLWGMWVDSPSDVLRFARAVERAHGIKEN